MDNKKCPTCGFINFVTADLCRKCETNLNYVDRPRTIPPKSGGFPILKVFFCIFGVVIVLSTFQFGMGLFTPKSKIEWREFRPLQGDFTVMMPTEPETDAPMETPLPGGKKITTHMYTSMVKGQGSTLYCVLSIPMIVSPNNPSGNLPYDLLPKALDDDLNNMLRKTNSTLVSKKSVILYSNPALEFEVRPPGNLNVKGAKGFGKMFFLGNKEYLLLVTAGEGSDLLADKDIFLNPRAN